MAIFDIFFSRRSGRPTIVGWILLALIAWFAISHFVLRNGSKSKSGRRNASETNPKFRKTGPAAPPGETDVKASPDKGNANSEQKSESKSKSLKNQNKSKNTSHTHKKHELDILKPKPKEFPVKLINEPSRKCHEGVKLLMIVVSQPEHFGAREMIRLTWGSYDTDRYKHLDITWQTIFVMGRTSRYDMEITAENKKHSDILQVDFDDNPYESTRKLMSAIQWVTDRLTDSCHIRFVMKTEDNVFHNMIAINGWLSAKYSSHLTKDEHLYVGKLIRKDKPIRDPMNALNIPKSDFSRTFFPDYIQSPVFLFSYYSFSKLPPLMKGVTPLAMDDAYTGLLVEKSGTIIPEHNDHFHLLAKPQETCHYLRMFFIYKVMPSEHLVIFKTMDDNIKGNKCSDPGHKKNES